MKLITEELKEIEVLKEEKENGGKDYYIKGVFLQAEAQNKNGRIYPKHILEKEVERYNQEIIKTGRAMGELGHPEGPNINLERVSHIVKELDEDGYNFVGKAKLLDTPYGKIAKNLLDEGVLLGVSSRGMGSLVPRNSGAQEVQDDFYLCTIDIVADPSAPQAFVSGIMEGKEWIWENGQICEKTIEEYKKTIHKAKQKEIDETAIKLFEDFLNKLKGK